jgi:hypothetical protein
MTTSPLPSFVSELENGTTLSEGTLAYFRERLRNRLHDLVLQEFVRSGINRADFARRIGRKPEQITRWLAAPGNWELDTVSDFLLGISGGEFDPQISYPLKEPAQDHSGPEWLNAKASAPSNQKSFFDIVVEIKHSASQAAYEDLLAQFDDVGNLAVEIAADYPAKSSNDNYPDAQKPRLAALVSE